MARSTCLLTGSRILELPVSVERAARLTKIKNSREIVQARVGGVDRAAFLRNGVSLMSVFFDRSGTAQPDRRRQIDLREIFDNVVQRVAPYFQHEKGLNGQATDYWAARAIREAYPDISSQQVQTLTVAAARYFRDQTVVVTPD